MTIRLPTLPREMLPPLSPAVSPPLPQQPPVLGVSSDYEAKTVPVTCTRGQEVSVYITSRRWRACDVFVEIPETVAQVFTLSIFVYAIAQGSRTLVASGRLVFNSATPSLEPRKWIVAARTVAERYEVTARVDYSTIAPQFTNPLLVTVAASDEMTEPPDELGSITKYGSPNGVKFAFVQMTIPPFLEVLAVQGVNTAGAARYLMLFDDTSTSFAGLTSPVMVWPLGDSAGQGFADHIRYRCRRAPALAISSTAGAYTAAADGAASITVR